MLLKVIVLPASFQKGLCLKKKHLLCDQAENIEKSQLSQRVAKCVNVSANGLFIKKLLEDYIDL